MMIILLIIFTYYTKIWITKYGNEISNSTFRRCTFYSFSILIFYLQLICWGLHCYKALERNKVELMKWNFQEKAPLQFAESTPLTVSCNSSQSIDHARRKSFNLLLDPKIRYSLKLRWITYHFEQKCGDTTSRRFAEIEENPCLHRSQFKQLQSRIPLHQPTVKRT